MDSFSKSIQRYHGEIIKLITASVFILFLIYSGLIYINYEVFLKLSFLERVLIIATVAFILGKVSYQLGNIVVRFSRWLIFQKNRKDFIKQYFEENIENLALGKRTIRIENSFITDAQMLDYIGKSEMVKNEYEDLLNEDVFWKSLNGLIFFLFGYMSINQSLNAIKFGYICIVLLLSLFVAIYASSKVGNFWGNCAMCVLRERDVKS